MPAYAQPHYLPSHEALFHGSVETPPVVCPDCIGVLPMVMREVETHWTEAKIDFIYECSDCGAEVRHTLTKQQH
jgi:DNA-directed RNA polymerase subunit RPC12/RpoP